MDVRVIAAERSHLGVLVNLMELYAYDFSEMDGFDVEDDGRFPPYPLAAYFDEAARSAFLIRANDHLAGFALIHRRSRLTGADDVWDMAEFFVLRKYRRAGVGMQAAHRLFASHPGRWEVRERRSNTQATAFWQKTIKAYAGDDFVEIACDDDRWRGPVQCFTSRG